MIAREKEINMTNYKYAAGITLLLWLISLILYVVFYCEDCNFWSNIFIGVFGSSILSFITSVIAYRQQRKATLEKFYNRTNELLHFWSKYFFIESTEEKVEYFLEYCDFSRFEWDEAYGDMDFFGDWFRRRIKYRNYICEKIYGPICKVSDTVSSSDRERYLRHYKRGVKNQEIFDMCDKEYKEGLDKYLLSSDPDRNIDYHLGHYYYRIMYGKRKCRKEQKRLAKK